MNFDKHTFRCSSLGYIMADAKEKSNMEKYLEAKETYDKNIDKYNGLANQNTKTADKILEVAVRAKDKMDLLEQVKNVPLLSNTCKTHLADVYTRVKYDRTEDLKSKYLEKGLELEEDAITLYSMLTGDFHKKNKERKFNEFIEGETDFRDKEVVYDTKVNWSIFQFDRVVAKPIKPLYHWQLDGYMWLWNKPRAKLVYTLLDTPEHLIKREESKLLYELFGSTLNYDHAPQSDKDMFKEAVAELRKNHTYQDIPLEEKVIIFEVKRDDTRIDRLKERVKDCRTYLNDFRKIKTIEDESDTDFEPEALVA